MTEPAVPWPNARSSRDGIIAQFGASRADLVGCALVTGDPLADAVVEEIHSGQPGVNAALNAGVRHGLESLTDAPLAVAALLASAETLPASVDDELIDHATAPFFSVPSPVHMVSLSAGALVRVYESPSIATVLTTTGRLIDGAQRRLQETGKWLMTQMLPGALRPGQPGYIATLQVRMLHAHMRRLARTRGYDEAAFGAPINQVDLARTWMDFTVTSYGFEEMLGYGYTASELATLYRYWQFAANVLGIDHRLVEGISNNEQAGRVDDLFQAVTGPPIEESGTPGGGDDQLRVFDDARRHQRSLRDGNPCATSARAPLSRRHHVGRASGPPRPSRQRASQACHSRPADSTRSPSAGRRGLASRARKEHRNRPRDSPRRPATCRIRGASSPGVGGDGWPHAVFHAS